MDESHSAKEGGHNMIPFILISRTGKANLW